MCVDNISIHVSLSETQRENIYFVVSKRERERNRGKERMCGLERREKDKIRRQRDRER